MLELPEVCEVSGNGPRTPSVEAHMDTPVPHTQRAPSRVAIAWSLELVVGTVGLALLALAHTAAVCLVGVEIGSSFACVPTETSRCASSVDLALLLGGTVLVGSASLGFVAYALVLGFIKQALLLMVARVLVSAAKKSAS